MHGDRLPGYTGYWCGWCEELVEESHDCCRAPLKRHLDYLELELARLYRQLIARPATRANKWLEEAARYERPQIAARLDVVSWPYRYLAARWWSATPTFAGFLLLNPAPLDPDGWCPTLSRVAGLAAGWGYSGVLVGNLYNYVAASPAELLHASRLGDPVGPEARRAVETLASASALLVVGWGAVQAHEPRARRLLHGPLAERELHVLGLSQGGRPVHPLAMRRDVGRYVQPIPWAPCAINRSAETKGSV